MEKSKQIEKAIRETLVITNHQSINIAVKKILELEHDPFKKSPTHSKKFVMEMMDKLNPDQMVKVVAFIQNQLNGVEKLLESDKPKSFTESDMDNAYDKAFSDGKI